MKKAIALVLLLSLSVFCAALADKPVYSVSGSVLNFDIDNDGVQEQILLTAEVEDGMGYVTINVSENNVVESHMLLMAYDPSAPELGTQIRIYPMNVSYTNLLFIETHAMGAENVYSSWMVVKYQDHLIQFPAFMYDPGWTSGVGLYEGNDPVDAQTYLMYSADYGSYSEQAYLKTLNARFSGYGISFKMEQLSFNGWYSAATVDVAKNAELALELDHSKLGKSTDLSSSSGSGYISGGDYVTVTGNTVYVRSGPDTNQPSVTVLKKGEKVPYLGQTDFDSRGVAWHYVNTKSGNGWISSKYSSNPLIDKLIPSKLTNKVEATASIHMRGGPSVYSSELGAVAKGTKLGFLGSICVDERGVSWFRVNYNGGIAWASSKYSKLV